MNPTWCACLFMAFALSYASECGPIRNYEEKTFTEGVYLSVRGESLYRAYLEFFKYSYRGNDQRLIVHLGSFIRQVEQRCGGSGAQDSIVYSRRLPDVYNKNPPQPISSLVKVDYQLGKGGTFFTRWIRAYTSRSITNQVFQLHEDLKCKNESFIDTWYNAVHMWSLFTGIVEIRVQKASSYMSKRKRCPPDDSNIEQLCKSNSNYSCPNMTFKETNGVAVRNISMYVVTGKPAAGVNCSYDHVQYSQYLGNHYYFMGKNTQSKKMMRTIPVMTKAIRISSHKDPCQKKYQMQFYVNTAHLDKDNLPCPTQTGVILQKVDNMQIYVKTVNGKPDTDMSQVKDIFMKELDHKNLPYVKDSHYLAQYRGHGPMFGHTLEIWVEKTEPKYVTICEGHKGVPVKPRMELKPTTTEGPSTTESMMISYY